MKTAETAPSQERVAARAPEGERSFETEQTAAGETTTSKSADAPPVVSVVFPACETTVQVTSVVDSVTVIQSIPPT